jgi:broad specificity phosphatase PhoE
MVAERGGASPASNPGSSNPGSSDPGSSNPGSSNSGWRRLYLLRHGEAAPIARDGLPVDPWMAPLTPRGRAHVAALAASLASCGIDLLVTSAVPRAVETAAMLAGTLAQTLAGTLPGTLAGRIRLTPVVDEGLNELRPGRVLAGSPDEVRQAVRHAYRDAGQPGARFLDGEPFAAFGLRVDQALARLLARPGWTRAAVVTHEPVLRLVLARCQGFGLAGLGGFEVATGSVTILDCAPWVATIDAAMLRLANGTGEEAARLP